MLILAVVDPAILVSRIARPVKLPYSALPASVGLKLPLLNINNLSVKSRHLTVGLRLELGAKLNTILLISFSCRVWYWSAHIPVLDSRPTPCIGKLFRALIDGAELQLVLLKSASIFGSIPK